jgi:HPt (histidine-containing phosphotransfer) domain-containing protein
MLAAVHQGVAEGDCRKVAQAAHKLAGSVGVLGSQTVIDAVEAAQRTALAGQVELMQQACEELDRQVQRLETSLGAVVKESAP